MALPPVGFAGKDPESRPSYQREGHAESARPEREPETPRRRPDRRHTVRRSRGIDSGDERLFAGIWGEHEALPYHPILRWARAHRERVERVVAFDEERWRTVVARARLDDTRNETMAAALAAAAAEHPAARIVAYGGSMHMMLAGRYRFDVDNRRPAGARLLELGVPRDQVVSIALDGDGMPLAAAWPGGTALDLGGAAGLLPFQYFHVYPIYRAARIRELHDYFVQLGALTEIEPWRPPGAATD